MVFLPGDTRVPDAVFKNIHNEQLWSGASVTPSLARFITKDSWMIFILLDMEIPKVRDWMTKDVNLWEDDINYQKFESYIQGVAVVNYCSERQVPQLHSTH